MKKLAVVLCILSLACTQALSAIYLEVEGIPGESKAVGHEGDIDVLSWSWGATNSYTIGGGGGGAGRVSMSGLVIHKQLDKASPKLMLSTCNGQHIPRAVLSVQRPTETNKSFEYLRITLDDVVVSSIGLTGGSDERPMEVVTLNFMKITMAYTEQRPDGSAGAVISASWNLATNTTD